MFENTIKMQNKRIQIELNSVETGGESSGRSKTALACHLCTKAATRPEARCRLRTKLRLVTYATGAQNQPDSNICMHDTAVIKRRQMLLRHQKKTFFYSYRTPYIGKQKGDS